MLTSPYVSLFQSSNIRWREILMNVVVQGVDMNSATSERADELKLKTAV